MLKRMKTTDGSDESLRSLVNGWNSDNPHRPIELPNLKRLKATVLWLQCDYNGYKTKVLTPFPNRTGAKWARGVGARARGRIGAAAVQCKGRQLVFPCPYPSSCCTWGLGMMLPGVLQDTHKRPAPEIDDQADEGGRGESGRQLKPKRRWTYDNVLDKN